MRVKLLAIAIVFTITNAGVAGTHNNKTAAAMLARKAVSEDAAEAAAAIAELRAMGPVGLEACLSAHAAQLQARRMEIAGPNPPAATARWQRLSAALDHIAGQKDSFASELYWYTDFDQAKQAAQQSGKPILSLRLLGRLDEELSCANSRFFRITLYANEAVAKLLRERYILHWQTWRPVPKITIDFGDGRKLERTITGNSIHYILDSDGRVVDALPGIYGPQAFQRELERIEVTARQCHAARTKGDRAALLYAYHRARLNELTANWTADLAKAQITLPLSPPPGTNASAAGSPRAEVAMRAALSKARIERPILRGISLDPRLLDEQPEDAGWARLGALHADDTRLDTRSRALMRSKNLSRFANAIDELQRTVTTLERVMATDAVRNEYIFRRQLHEWFLNGVVTDDLAQLNEKVYAELFLTPSADKWLGLFPDDSYTGIENDGVRR